MSLMFIRGSHVRHDIPNTDTALIPPGIRALAAVGMQEKRRDRSLETEQTLTGKDIAMKASVSVKCSYDYNNFEISLTSDEDMTFEQVNEMRKEAQRLVDKAIKQYKIMKGCIQSLCNTSYRYEELRKQLKIITENFPKSEWTPEQKAIEKAFNDMEYQRIQWEYYNYEDDYED